MAQDRLQIELLLEPEWHRGEERAQSLWREPEVGLEHALELDPGFVIEDDVIGIGEANSRLRQTIRDGMAGKTRIMLAAAKQRPLRPRPRFPPRERPTPACACNCG